MSKTERLFHPRTLVIHPDFKNLEEFIVSIPRTFPKEWRYCYSPRGAMNCGKWNTMAKNMLSNFHSPHLINRFVYGIFRPSKAKRSYDHAEMLLKIGVGTPQPVGYMNIRSGLLFDKSYYISLLSTCPYIYDNLFTQQFDYAEEYSCAIGKVTARLHETRIRPQRLHGRANILFQKTPNGINNRNCRFEPMYIGLIDMKTGCKILNACRQLHKMHRWMVKNTPRHGTLMWKKCFELMKAYRSVQPGKNR